MTDQPNYKIAPVDYSISVRNTDRREVMKITPDGQLILDFKDAPEAAQILHDEWVRLTGGPKPMPITTAPRDGTLFDMTKDGIRYTDCHFDDMGYVVKEHDYPSVEKRFLNVDGATWTPRPDGLILPYAINEKGVKYVP